MPNRPPQPPNPKPGTGSTSTNTIGGKIDKGNRNTNSTSTNSTTGGSTSGGNKGGMRSNTQPPVIGTSTNPIYGGGSTITTPGDRSTHPGRTPGVPISHLGHTNN